mmetsp:Transcript_16241/g.40407  ORF Transcript_16241/g.40407 Transcript_16241/m.40407 type:complete len:150 (-) Transcript_16241:708-1157(-)|eukprot:CAMPEP_0202859190 /NCGR_PEP_ID=MMETSP1391-20130828/1418_1 /ASSEMBLY_ACC=CAM_ASM_000867 /TAXON_ID=1034604 /ORGANISM="Chlamydomonas leiostraca, Strain SAG 11-49" /LENGTH=149 /DNA_ID=CAMNT_0049538205 /DNA_START=100 /DNA_END=549 /DNA_ORIENTATION=-
MANPLTIEDRLDSIINSLAELKHDVAELKHDVGTLTALQRNSCARLADRLVKVPLPDGSMPDQFPPTLGALIVGGSELTPGGDNTPGWNKQMSLALIRKYDPAYDTDGDDSDPDTDNKRRSSRRRRLHLARLIGVTPAQMQAGLMEAVL